MKSVSLLLLLVASPSFSQDAHKLLVDLIKIDTTNPPGRETLAAQLLSGRLKTAGIPSEIFESTPGRGSLVARLKGDGSKRPLILMAHLDVVGSEPARWSVPPFAAVEKDGYLYGRGAIDDKGMAAAAAAVMIEVKRSGLALKRDLILLTEADEESGGRAGIRFLLAKHKDKLGDAEYALNEGGSTELKDGRVVRVSIQAAEKRYHDVRLTAHGTPGHASIPLRDNAVFRLSAALTRLEKYEPEIRLNTVTRTFFTGVAPMRTRRFQEAVKDLVSDSPEKRKAAARVIAEEHPANQAMLMDTVVPTILSGGIRANVIPSEASVNLNCRLLPDRDTDAFLSDLRTAIADPTIEITAVERPSGAPQGSMPLDNEMYATLTSVSNRLWPSATVLPYMSTGATDSEYLRDLGIKAYGIGLPMDASDEMRMHGDDERISVDGLAQGTRFLLEVVKELNR